MLVIPPLNLFTSLKICPHISLTFVLLWNNNLACHSCHSKISSISHWITNLTPLYNPLIPSISSLLLHLELAMSPVCSRRELRKYNNQDPLHIGLIIILLCFFLSNLVPKTSSSTDLLTVFSKAFIKFLPNRMIKRPLEKNCHLLKHLLRMFYLFESGSL